MTPVPTPPPGDDDRLRPRRGLDDQQQRPQLHLHSSEPPSSFECSIDTGFAAFGPCSGPGAATPALADGSYTFRVRATDGAANTDQTPATRSFTVDTTAPDTIIDAGPSGTTADSTPSFEFHSTEAGSSFECSIDTGLAAFGPCSGPGASHTPSALADGSYTFRVRATDGAANTDQTPATRSFTVDTTAPDTIIDAGPSGTTADSTPSFEFHSTEAGSSFECSIDTGLAAFGPCSGPGAAHTPAALADGSYTFRVRATDGAANTDQTPATRSFTVDTTAPDTIIDAGPSGTTADSTPSFEFHSTEAGSSFECSIDTGLAAFGPCSGPGAAHTPAALADGSYTFRVRATDGAANTDQTPATRTFTVDTTAPPTNTEHGEPPGQCKAGFKKQKHHGKTKCVKIKKPHYGKFAVVALVHGKVLIKVPGGKGFVRLTDDDQIPLGTIIDTTQGRVRLTCAKSRQGDDTQTADFWEGVFRVGQPASGKPTTELKLIDTFGKGQKHRASSSKARKGNNRLWGSGHGNFVTKGSYGSASVLGTIWLTEDRPTGTFFKVKRGIVQIQDFTRHRKLKLHPGQDYLAPAP